MKAQYRILLVMAAYFAVATGAYAYWSLSYFDGELEVIGTAAMALLAIMSVFIAFYLNMNDRRTATLPEDRLDGEIADDAGEVGFFSPWSWWPFMLGISGALTFASLAVGWWLFFIALPIGIVSVAGFVFEYSRGAHAH